MSYDRPYGHGQRPPPSSNYRNTWPGPSFLNAPFFLPPNGFQHPPLPPMHIPNWYTGSIDGSFTESQLQRSESIPQQASLSRPHPPTDRRYEDHRLSSGYDNSRYHRPQRSPRDSRRYSSSQSELPYGRSSTSYDGAHHRHSTEPSPRTAWAGETVQPLNTRRCAPLRPLVKVNQEVQATNSTQLSLLSYNMLAQDLIAENMYLYSHRAPGHLDWDFRKNNLLSELAQTSADIVCLQEVQEDCYKSWFNPELSKLGYAGLYKRRTGSRTDGCALFYKQDRLKLLDYKGVEFRRDFKILNRDNVGIVAKFMPKQNRDESEGLFCVATTHLLFNPKAGEVKLAQLSYLMAELHQMATTPDNDDLLPVILCGDFNSVPYSHLYNFITTSYLDYSNLSAVEVSGYHKRSRNSRRVIPNPLLPSNMCIGNDCRYSVRVEPQTLKVVDLPGGKSATSNSNAMATDEVIVIDDSDNDSVSISQQKGRLQSQPVDSQNELATKSSKCAIIQAGSQMDWAPESVPKTDGSIADKASIKGSSISVTDTSSQCTGSTSAKALLTIPFKFNSAYPHSAQPPKSTVTTYHQSAFETVDYIFYTPMPNSASPSGQGEPSRMVGGLHLLCTKLLPSAPILLGLGPQPHEFLSSDHLFLQVTFQLVW